MESPEKLSNPLVKEVIRKENLNDDILGMFIKTDHARIHLSDFRSKDILSGTKTLTHPPDGKKAIVYLGSWSINFGKSELEQHKLSQLAIDYGIQSYEGNKIKLEVRTGIRDKYGDQPWNATIELIVMFFK